MSLSNIKLVKKFSIFVTILVCKAPGRTNPRVSQLVFLHRKSFYIVVLN